MLLFYYDYIIWDSKLFISRLKDNEVLVAIFFFKFIPSTALNKKSEFSKLKAWQNSACLYLLRSVVQSNLRDCRRGFWAHFASEAWYIWVSSAQANSAMLSPLGNFHSYICARSQSHRHALVPHARSSIAHPKTWSSTNSSCPLSCRLRLGKQTMVLPFSASFEGVLGSLHFLSRRIWQRVRR